jgi:hypothetical protein
MSEQGMNDVDTGAIMCTSHSSECQSTSDQSMLIGQTDNDYKTTFYQFTIDNKFNEKFFGPCAHNINVKPGDRLCLIPYSCIWPDEIASYDGRIVEDLIKDWANDQLMERLTSDDDHKYDVALDSNHTSLLDLMCTYRFYSKRILIDKKMSIYDFYLKGISRFNGMIVKIKNFWFLNFELTKKSN